MTLLRELVLRVSIIVVVTDLVEFYVLRRRHTEMTLSITLAIIAVTIIPIIINIWYALHRRGLI